MSEFDELLGTLRVRDVQLWVKEDRLRYRAPVGALEPPLRQAMAKHRDRLIEFLSAAAVGRSYRVLGRNNLLVEMVAGNPRKVPPFFCVGLLEAISDTVPREQPFYAFPHVPYLSRDRSASLRTWATTYLEEILSVQPRGPYFLGGFCYAGVFAYEIAQQLLARGREVSFLALIETPAPTAWFEVVHRLYSARCHRALRFIDSTAEQKLVSLRSWTNRRHRRHDAGGPSPEAPSPLAEPPTSRGRPGARVGEDGPLYQPKKYPGPVTLFLADQGSLAVFPFSRAGWTGLATGRFEHHRVPGQHVEILREPHVALLAEKFNRALREAHGPDIHPSS